MAGHGGGFERNSVAGLWQLNDLLLPQWSCQVPLDTIGFSISGAPGPHFQPQKS
jgi:hypothetical protein